MYNKRWYNSLNRSSLSPPDFVFGIVWPILYAMMAISLYLTINNKKCVGFCRPLPFFIIQLALNLSWTTIFFKMRMKNLAFLTILIIIFFTLITFKELQKISKKASYFLIPYILWLCFAGYLNLYIVINNK